MYNRQIMTRYLENMKAQTEFEHVKGVPPLDIILYRGTINLGDLILLFGLRVFNLFYEFCTRFTFHLMVETFMPVEFDIWFALICVHLLCLLVLLSVLTIFI
jgi:hypothetical protein